MKQKHIYKLGKILTPFFILALVISFNSLPFFVNKAKAVCIPPNASSIGANPNPVAANTSFTLNLGGSSGNGTNPMRHISGGGWSYDGPLGSVTEPGIAVTTTFYGYIDTQGPCGDSSNEVSTIVTVSAPPATGTVAVTSNNAGATWTFPGSASNPCGTCSGITQTYTNKTTGTYIFSSSTIYANSKVSSSSASGGSSCSSSTQCNLTGAGQVNFTSTYTPTTCTVRVQGIINPSTQAATGQTFQISGPPGITSGTDSTGLQTYTLQSDAAGSTYTLTATSHNNLVTVGGYVSDYNGVDGSGNSGVYSDSQTCFPGGTITFTINYITKPILNVQ